MALLRASGYVRSPDEGSSPSVRPITFFVGTKRVLSDIWYHIFMNWRKYISKTAQAANPKEASSAEDILVQRINAAIADAVPFTKSWEKYREKAYWDSVGKKWTVGHGHTRIPDATTGKMRDVVEGDKMSEGDSNDLMQRIMRQNAVKLYQNVPWFKDVSQGTMSAILDKSYNAGWRTFAPSVSKDLDTKMNMPGADPDAAYWSEHDTYASARGKKVPGLVNRQNASWDKWSPYASTEE